MNQITRKETTYSINFYIQKENDWSSQIVSIDKENKTLRWSGLDRQSIEDAEMFQKALKIAINELKNLN